MLWLPAISVLSWSQGRTEVAAVDMLILILGIVYLWINAPWKRPDTRIHFLIAGMVLLLFLAGVYNALILVPTYEWGFDNLWWLLFPVFFVIPCASFGNKTWRELHGEKE